MKQTFTRILSISPSIKSFVLSVFFLTAFKNVCFAQPTVLGTDIVNGSYVTYDLNTIGGFKQYRIQALNNGVSGALQVQFASGTAASTNYTLNWRPYSGSCSGFSNVQISGYNNFIAPNVSFPATTATATYNSTGGGCPGFLPAVTANNYYTFNITNNAAANNNMAVLETTYNPETIISVTRSPATVGAIVSPTITVTMSSAPVSNVYVRYSTNAGFATSTIVQLSFVGATGTATIPVQASGATVYYYVYSSTRTKAAIDADVVTYGQSVHDMATLNLNNNAGANYSYTVLPVTVNATNAVNDASYLTLKAAFDAINLGTHTGVINVWIGGNTTETLSAVLNASGAPSSYTAITVKPAGFRTVTGAIAGPLVDLNGADNIIIDGIADVSNTLTFTNTSTGGAGTSTIRMYNNAITNTVQNCNIEGSTLSTTDGVVTLGSGTNTTLSISNNNIRAVGANLPIYSIYSSGTNTAVTVSTNNIENYFSATVNAAGIYANTACNAWTISTNKFYQTSSRTITGSAIHARAIWVTFGGGHTISGNTIGYGTSAGGGSSTYITTNTNNQIIPIELAGNTTASSIQGNTIAAFIITSASNLTSTTAAGIFSGIYVSSGTANIGTTTGNTIGAATGNGSISITCSATAGSPILFISGIYAASASPNIVNISNNNIGSINVVAASAAVQFQFYGIYVPSGVTVTAAYTIADNLIGSTSTTNSIVVGTASTSITNFAGIASGTTGTVSVPGNTVQNCTVSGTGLSSFGGISVANSTGVLSITNNNIISCSNAGTLAFIPISNASATTTLTISGNIIRSNTISSATCAFTGILNSGAVTSAININNNQLGNATGGLITFTIANSSNLFGINNTAGTAAAALTIQANNFQGITNSVQGTGNHTYIFNNAATLSQNISTNTFTSLTANITTTGGGVTFISNSVSLSASGSKIVNDNAIVTSFTKTGAGSNSIYFYYDIGGSVAGAIITNEGNNFSNVTINGATTCNGWLNGDGSGAIPVKNIYNNTFANITANTSGVFPLQINNGTGSINGNTITNCTSPSTLRALYVAGGSFNIYSNTINTLSSSTSLAEVTGVYLTGGTAQNIYYNTIHTLSSSATSTTVSAVRVVGGTTVNVYKNKIYDISNSALGSSYVMGINITGGTTVSLYNNLIGNLATPASNVDDAIRGISVLGGTTVNVYYNTVYINASSSGASFGSAALYANTTPTLDMRNNILYNISTPGTGVLGKTVAYRRNGTLLTSYAASSDNNLFYAFTPGAKNLIFYDGTNSDQALATYQTRVATSRDTTSVTASLAANFVSTVGSSINFLHLNGTSAAESGAETIAGLTDDYDAEIRFGNAGYTGTGTRADIGADEFESVVCPGGTPTIDPIVGGPYYAGDPITITGTNLLNITYATINNINVTIGAITATSAVLTIPTNLADSVAVVQVAFTSSCPFSATANFVFAGYITTGLASGNGTWSTPSIWRNSAVPVPNAPATINNNNTVTLDVSADPIKFTINSTASFTHANNSCVFGTTYLNNTTVNGTLVIDDALSLVLSANKFISPKLMVNNGGVFTNNSATAAAVTIANFYVYAGGTYNHNAVGSVANGVTNDFPGSTLRSFGATSNVVITKWATNASTPVALPASGATGWGNLTINTSTVTYAAAWNQVGNLTNVQGNMLVQATGGVQFQLKSGGSGTVGTAIAGNLTVSGGSFGCASGSSVNYTTTIGGNLLVNGTGTIFQVTMGSIGSTNFTVTGSATIGGTAFFWNTGTIANNPMSFGSLDVTGQGEFCPSASSSNVPTVTVTGAFTVTGGFVIDSSGTTYTYNAGSLSISSGLFNPSKNGSSITNITVASNLTVSGTGSFASTSSGSVTLNIAGDYIQSSNSATAFRFQNSSAASKIYRMVVGGNFNLTNGTFIGGSRSDTGSPDSILFKGGLATATYTQNGGSILFSSSGIPYGVSHFAVYPGKTLLQNNSITPASTPVTAVWSFTVYSGGILDCGTTSEIGGGNVNTIFRLKSGATLQTGHVGGVFNATAAAASITTAAANAILDAGATYVYNGVAPQVSSVFATTPATTPYSMANMVINNITGVTLNSSYNVTTALQMQGTAGNLTLSTFNLTTASISTSGAGFSNTKMVVTNSTGALGQPVALATILYPVGNGANYTPASYTFTVNSTARYLNVRAATPRNANDVTATNYINNRWWNTDLSVTTGSYTYTSVYTYISGDMVGTAASIRLNRWTGSAWVSDPSSVVNNTTFTITSGTLTEATGTLSATAEWVGRVYVAPAIYHWINPVGGSWLVPTNWTPTGVPGSGDGVIFDVTGGATYTTTNMPTSMSLTQFIVSTNNLVTYNAGAAGAVNMIYPGTATPQFSIAAGSTMTIGGTNVVTFNLPTNATGNVAGSLNLQNASHRVTVATASALTFPSGGYFSYGVLGGSTYIGNPFGTTGTTPTVIFQNGSVCECFEGSNPFGATVPDKLAVFNSGSLFRYSDIGVATLPSASGRTYANFTYNANKTANMANAANSFICDSLTVTVGTINFDLRGTPTPDHAVRGNINVASGATLSFSPGAAGTVNMNSGTTQTIWGAGTFNINASCTFDINAGTTASMQKNIGVVGTGNVQVNGTLICTGENNIGSTGIVALNNGGTLSMQSVNGISNAGVGNIRTTTFTYNNGGNFTYSGNANQVTGNRLPLTLSGTPLSTLTIANTGTAPTNIVTLTTNNTQTAKINLNAGQFNAGTGGTLIIDGGTNLVVGNGGNQYLSGTATDNIIRFASNGAVQNTPELWNVTIGNSVTGVDFTNNARINGILLINSGGYVNPNAPKYNTGSYLIYNTTGSYNRALEWSNNTGLGTPGYPHHVTVQNGTTLDFLSPAFDLGCGGDLTLGTATAGTLVLSSYVQPYDLYVKGNINIGGTAAGTLTMSNSVGCDLKLTGNWTRTATGIVNFGGGNGRSVYFEGSTDATITASGGQYFPYVRMTKAAKATKVTLADHVSVGFEATFTTGTLDLGTNNKFFSLLSNVNYDARVDVSDSTNTAFVYGTDDINGQFIVHRYFPARRAWRLVNAPFKRTGGGTHSISQAWQEQGNGLNGFDFTSANYLLSIGTDTSGNNSPIPVATHITGNTSTSTGFDLSPNNQSSIKSYTAGTWVTPANTNNTGVNSQEGWLLFVRGDRINYGDITNQYKAPTITTLRPRGQIFIGQKTITASNMQTVGNPYASAVDYNAMSRTGSGWPALPRYYVWDPYLGGSQGVGAFVLLEWNGTNSFNRISAGYGTGTYDNRYIPSGAAIMVEFPAGGGTLSMNEANKNTDSNTTAFRPVRQLQTLLQSKDTNNIFYVADGALSYFSNSFNTDADINDAPKLGNINENFALQRKGSILCMEKMKLTGDNDTVFYFMNRMQRKNYQLQFNMDDMQLPASTAAFLEDIYLKKKTPVALQGVTETGFAITADAGSFAPDRFRLVFRKSVKYISLNALIVNDDVAVHWNVNDELNIEKYEIERSDDGRNFSSIGTKLSNGDSEAPVSYIGMDAAPAPGEYYYRIKSVSKNGIVTYSDAVKVKVVKSSSSLYVFPNPVTNSVIQLQLNKKSEAGIYVTTLFNSNGQVVNSELISHAGGTATKAIQPKQHLISGAYQLKVTGPDGKQSVIKVVVANE